MYLQLIINPGSTSTKLAIYRNMDKLVQEDITHCPEELAVFPNIIDQVPLRKAIIGDFLKRHNVEGKELSCVMGRGGLLPGLRSGGFLMTEELKLALGSELAPPHASNLGGILAYEIAKPLGIPAYIYDAVSSAELPPLARILGTELIERSSFCHALNARAQGIRYAEKMGKDYKDLRLIVAHVGGGISLSVHVDGKIVESVSDDEGPFSPERAGMIPALELLKLCYSGKFSYDELRKKLRGHGGMYAHLRTADVREILRRIEEGDEKAKLIFEAHAYSLAKAIGSLAATMKGRVDAIILTGGVSHAKLLTDLVTDYVSFIAPVVVQPGENEMEALAAGGMRLLSGEEQPKLYHLPEGNQI